MTALVEARSVGKTFDLFIYNGTTQHTVLVTLTDPSGDEIIFELVIE